MKQKISLYQCGNAVENAREIWCKMGKALCPTSKTGNIHIEQHEKGKPLEIAICQECRDYDCFGPPIPASERGWLNMKGEKC